MKNQIDDALERAAARWVAAAAASPRAVIAGIVIATLLFGAYAATHLGVNSDNIRLVAEDLPSRRNHEAFAALFPNLENALLIVIDGETPEITRDATETLWRVLMEQDDRFHDVYLPGGGEFFEHNGLLYRSVDDLYEFADGMARVQPVIAELEREATLAKLADIIRIGLEASKDDPDGLEWSTILDQVGEATVSIYAEAPLAVSWETILLEGSTLDVVRRRVIVADPILDFTSFLAAGRAIEHIREAARAHGLVPEQGVRVRITGNPALNFEEMFLIAIDILYAGGICFLFVVGILFVAFRSLPLTIAAVAALLTGLVWSAAFAAVAIGHLNLVSMSFAVLFIGLGVDFGIHLCMAYADALRDGATHPEALEKSAREVGSSLVICAFTTSLGFFVFVPTDYKGVSELGLIAGTGMFVILFQNLTLVPALLSWRLRVDPAKVQRHLRFRGQWWQAMDQHPRPIALGALLLAIGAMLLVPSARFDPNVVAMRDPSTESVQTFNDLLADSGTASPWFTNSVAPGLEAAIALGERMRELDSVSTTITLADYIPTDQEEKLEILADLAFLLDAPVHPPLSPAAVDTEAQLEALRALRDLLREKQLGPPTSPLQRSAALLEQRLSTLLDAVAGGAGAEDSLAELERLLLSGLQEQIDRLRAGLDAREITFESLPESLVQRLLKEDGRARLQIFPAEDLASEEAFDRFANEVLSVDPKATGVATNLVGFARAIRSSFQQALISAILAISTILWLLWRRLSITALAMAPILLASMVTVAAMVLLDLPFNFANVIVIPLLMGIGVDSGIHLVHRHLTTPGASLMQSTTARAVFYSAVTTVVSFGSLAFSSHRGLSNMGTVLALGMLFTVMANLVVLPALIALRRSE